MLRVRRVGSRNHDPINRPSPQNTHLQPRRLGIKVVNIHTNKLTRLLGKQENTQRMLRLALFQGRPKTTGSVMQEMGAAAVTTSGSAVVKKAEVCSFFSFFSSIRCIYPPSVTVSNLDPNDNQRARMCVCVCVCVLRHLPLTRPWTCTEY